MQDNKKYVTYEEFGAVGDGVHDDMPAIVACHEYANENHLAVRAKDGAEYYIGGKTLIATIKTNTNFGTAKFTIDDRDVLDPKAGLFRVVSDFEAFTPEITSLFSGQKKIDFPHEGTLYVRVATDTKKIFKRRGPSANSGSDASDCFIVDPDGNILTDINWDYPTVSFVSAKCVDDEPITLEGGIFTTVANQSEPDSGYYNRGFYIERSHVTVKDMQYYVTGELDRGAPYGGFLTASDCYDVTFRDTVLTPHKTYYIVSKINGQRAGKGTYAVTLGHVIGGKLINLTQSRDIVDLTFCGLLETDFCKDMTLINCKISRFDAHCGVTNATVRGCEFGFAGINLIGFGDVLIEDTTVRHNRFINFRSDYGSSFSGNLTIRNCKWIPYRDVFTSFFSSDNDGMHDFGYVCRQGKSITVDGVYIGCENLGEDREIFIFNNFDKTRDASAPYPYLIAENVSISGIEVDSGKGFTLYEDPTLYEKANIRVN